jgi:hypothetical protein
VWRELAHSDADGAPTPSASGLSQARRRLGAAPLAALFVRLRGPQAVAGAPGAFLSGLRLVSWDATMLDVPDSPANAEAFIGSVNARGRGAFAKVRLLTPIECGTHAVIDAVFGAVSEQALARQVLGSLGEGMLLLGDRNFPSHRLWREAAATCGVPKRLFARQCGRSDNSMLPQLAWKSADEGGEHNSVRP